MTLAKGKKGLIMGVANDRSIAWGISQKLAGAGAELAFTYLGEALKKRVIPLAKSLNSEFTLNCNVENKEEVVKLFEDIKTKWGQIDFVVHAIAYSDRDELKGKYVDTSKDNFSQTMLISCYSFTAVCNRAQKLMTNGGSLITLTYAGSERVMPHYNVMGVAKAGLEASVKYLAEDLGPKNIRVNALSPGPMKTLAAAGV